MKQNIKLTDWMIIFLVLGLNSALGLKCNKMTSRDRVENMVIDLEKGKADLNNILDEYFPSNRSEWALQKGEKLTSFITKNAKKSNKYNVERYSNEYLGNEFGLYLKDGEIIMIEFVFDDYIIYRPVVFYEVKINFTAPPPIKKNLSTGEQNTLYSEI